MSLSGPHSYLALQGSCPPIPWPLLGMVPPQLCCFLQIGVAFSQSNVSSYVVDLTRVTRTGMVAQDPVQDSLPLAQQPPLPTAPLRRIYERPSTTCSKPQRWAQGALEGTRSGAVPRKASGRPAWPHWPRPLFITLQGEAELGERAPQPQQRG